uniref:Biogenic amine-like GPCR n=1 Tax=Tripedalia cystophora TaxID=6141 RepID=A0A481ZM25_TRICY|nr:biogenic amine-like GPCR [Tripedalia cystophora]
MASPCAKAWAPTALSYFTASVSGILGILATTGNLLIIAAVIKDPLKKLRTPFMYFLVNLAFSDLIVGCVTMPTSVVTHTLEAHGTKKRVHATIIQLSYFMSSTASMLSLATLCIDRYLAVRHPMSYRRRITLSLCIAVSVVIWILSISLPFLFFVVGYMNYLMIFAHSAVVLTLIIIAFTYKNIYSILTSQAWKLRGARHSSAENLNVDPGVEASRTASERHVVQVFLFILCYVVICYVPAIICIYILRFCPKCDCNFRHVLRDLQFLFIVSNSCVNPFLCSIRLRPFRRAIIAMLGLSRFLDKSESAGESNQKTGNTPENSTPVSQQKLHLATVQKAT